MVEQFTHTVANCACAGRGAATPITAASDRPEASARRRQMDANRLLQGLIGHFLFLEPDKGPLAAMDALQLADTGDVVG
jgi:hypothetical protein